MGAISWRFESSHPHSSIDWRPVTVAFSVFIGRWSRTIGARARDGTMTTETDPEKEPHSEPMLEVTPYAALRERDFLYFLIGHIVSVLGVQMQTVAIGWQLYEKTGSAWPLGLVGLVMAVPMIGLAPIAGQAADRFDRRRVLMSATWVAVISSLGLGLVSARGAGLFWIYLCLFGSGLARAFQGPARSSLMPLLVRREIFVNSVTWAVSGFELASMIGPALGGMLIAILGGATWIYLGCAL
ncbi:MAG: MFS transporter, partial [Acidobacteria bacterium]|nr:MFS transporter [Acidobacteriota bacterium]